MFAIIETKGATHIAIYVPHEGAEKSLPALAAMLENNAVFISQGYNEMKVVNPEMSIKLGDVYSLTRYNEEEIIVRISESRDVLSYDFKEAKPSDVFINALGSKKRDDEIAKLKVELAYVRAERDELKSRLVDSND